MSQILFAAEIAFCGLHGGMSQQELDLLQFTTAIMALLGTGSPQIMRSNVLQSKRCGLVTAANFRQAVYRALVSK